MTAVSILIVDDEESVRHSLFNWFREDGYEVGIATLYLARHKPTSVLKMGPMGLSMFAKGRLAILPTKIRQVDQLQAIVQKAREIGGAS